MDVGDGADLEEANEGKYTYQMVNALCFMMPRWIGTRVQRRYWSNLFAKNKNEMKWEQSPVCLRSKR